MDYLKRQAQMFDYQARRVYRDTSIKNVHELRVTIRRIRAALWLVEHSSRHHTFKKLRVSLRKLGQALGECRELDVAIQDAGQYHLKVGKIKAERKTARRKLLVPINPKNIKKILEQLESAVRKVQKYPELDLTPGIIRLRSNLSPWMSKNNLSDQELHTLRILAKKNRYILEAFKTPTQPLRKLQGFLGRGHDLTVLQDYLGKNFKVQLNLFMQNRKAKRAIKPALQFTLKQLDTIIESES